MDTQTAIPTWTLSDRLRKAREDAGISVKHMAEHVLGVSRNTVTRYEHNPGKRGVPNAVVRVYADVTSVDRHWLETGAGSRSRCFSDHDPLQWVA